MTQSFLLPQYFRRDLIIILSFIESFHILTWMFPRTSAADLWILPDTTSLQSATFLSRKLKFRLQNFKIYSWKECMKTRNCLIWTISLFLMVFSKDGCYWAIKVIRLMKGLNPERFWRLCLIQIFPVSVKLQTRCKTISKMLPEVKWP